jgi:3-phenylpropionate/cinnamic acid dioxygenase small subunit
VDKLDDLLARLEAEREITAVLYRYGDGLDQGHRQQFLDCFSSDAHYQVNMRLNPEGGFSFDGHEELGSYFDGHTHAPDAFHKHVTVNPLITLDGDGDSSGAQVNSYFMRVDSPGAGPAVVLAAGRYIDRFARGEDGRWRIQSRDCEVENL